MKIRSLVLLGVAAATLVAGSVQASLINVSLLGLTGRDMGDLVVGFTISGTGSKQALLRAIGPGLAQFGIAGHPDPYLSLSSGGKVLVQTAQTTGAGWSGSPALSAVFAQVGAFPLDPGSNDAVLLQSLPPGGYSAHASGTYVTGEILTEIWDADVNSGTLATARLTNLSAYGVAPSSGLPLTIGFVVAGSSEKVLLRALGPSLVPFHIVTPFPPAASASLRVFDAAGNVLASSAAWAGDAPLAAAFAQAGAFPIANDSPEGAIVLTLPPGAYSMQISATSANGLLPGTAMAEIYELPQ